ncbi:hypothetical protein B0H10DRAFT_2371901 [Mycena sp. CBHHK59/15]|nr:hypothetical protein B0H10DRAFT_2371901 [Mycena sp. CBHHK59/15]
MYNMFEFVFHENGLSVTNSLLLVMRHGPFCCSIPSMLELPGCLGQENQNRGIRMTGKSTHPTVEPQHTTGRIYLRTTNSRIFNHTQRARSGRWGARWGARWNARRSPRWSDRWSDRQFLAPTPPMTLLRMGIWPARFPPRAYETAVNKTSQERSIFGRTPGWPHLHREIHTSGRRYDMPEDQFKKSVATPPPKMSRKVDETGPKVA